MDRKGSGFRGLAGVAVLAVAVVLSSAALAAASQPDAILLTIFLKHDQTKTLAEIDRQLERTGFWRKFPPAGTEVVS
ncbi:MAG: hypothetical protein M1438_21230 [Deltaproteobacteria bacterium]|nr:hypothetical protein [Deltaproteobacteria bacterium]